MSVFLCAEGFSILFKFAVYSRMSVCLFDCLETLERFKMHTRKTMMVSPALRSAQNCPKEYSATLCLFASVPRSSQNLSNQMSTVSCLFASARGPPIAKDPKYNQQARCLFFSAPRSASILQQASMENHVCLFLLQNFVRISQNLDPDIDVCLPLSKDLKHLKVIYKLLCLFLSFLLWDLVKIY